ncbi:hypothetical protein [Phytohabitans houttuyneae]|uniref:ATP-binding protein n=2 Tax=Phytohabitans houttuyneae TaxID=1076126 RepID=UPI0031EBFC5E
MTWLGRPWRDRAWLHPLYGTATVYVAGSTIEAVVSAHPDWPVWAVGAATGLVGAATTAAGVLAAAGDRFTGWARGYLGAAGLAGGTWLTYAAVTSPYEPKAVVSALVGAALFTGAYPAVRHAQLEHEAHYRAVRARPAPPVAAAVPQFRNPEAARWEGLLASVGLAGCTYRDREENRAGFAILISLPTTGKVTYRQVVGKCDALEIATKMPEGTVHAERAVSPDGRTLASEVWIHFDVEDILTKTLPMPDDHTPLSINAAFPVGLFADGEPILLKLREIAMLIVGVRGRGKTNLLNVIIHQLSRCTDVVIWMIDLKGGRAAKPWLKPWLDGKVKRPVLDWVATTRTEAHRMLVGGHALIEQRANAGYGGSKVEPTRQRPAVIVICDEIAALVGQHARGQKGDGGPKLYDLIAQLTLDIQLGRSEAVDFVLATQRGTVTMTGSGDLKSQCELRAGLGVTSPQDAQSVFTGNAPAAKLLAKLKDKATRGAVLIQDGDGGRISPGKLHFYGDGDAMLANVHRAATLHANYPAPLDEAGARAVDAAVRKLYDGSGYSGDDGRWSAARAEHLYADDGLPPEFSDDEPAASTPAQPAVAEPTARASSRGGRFMPTREERAARREAREQQVYDDEWAQIVEHFQVAGEPEPDAAPPADVDRYEAMIAIIAQAGRSGIMPGQVLARMVKQNIAWDARTSMYPALKRALADGRIVQPGGRKGLYYTPENAG